MPAVPATLKLRIGIYGPDTSQPDERHGCRLWPAGVAAALTYAEVTPVTLPSRTRTCWDDHLEALNGLVVIGHESMPRQSAAGEEICAWAHDNKLPVLAIDQGLLALNASHGGLNYGDLAKELPEALQHRHPPERGLRHAINVIPGTHLASLYGEGEVVVNSEHRRAVQRLARGFRVCAQALDGVIEAIEFESDWYALGVQWQPATATASGLDIQLFRGLVNAAIGKVGEHRELQFAA
jgi:putative glutamine amidotransferase